MAAAYFLPCRLPPVRDQSSSMPPTDTPCRSASAGPPVTVLDDEVADFAALVGWDAGSAP